jgi:3-oxoacyl-[acyl-carrier protein] reductase
MNLQLQGKTALVLASSKGLGKACAEALAAEGANLAMCARGAAGLEETAAGIRKASSVRVEALPVDVRDPDSLEKFVAQAMRIFGRIDILVNNAGGPPFGSFGSFDDKAWTSAFDLNLMSFVRASRFVIPHLRSAGGGRIINIVSLSVKTFLPGSILSTSIRLAVVGAAKMLAQELGPDQITVNNVAPGFILTDRLRENSGQKTGEQKENRIPDPRLEERIREIPLGRFGNPKELADLVCFLASPRASYITGATIPVDGGAIRAIY